MQITGHRPISTWLLAAALATTAGCGGGDRRADDAGDALDATVPDAGEPVRTGPFRVLFDDTKDERAGSADWVVDGEAAVPSPDHPDTESGWNGGLSSWGWELHGTGDYEIEQLPDGAAITLGDGDNAQDLSRFDAFVVPEPNSRFTQTEAEAIVAFVRAGGGLFVIGNHRGADRNNDGFDPPEVWNDFFDATGNPFGVRFAGDDITDSPDDNVTGDPFPAVLEGPFGPVRSITYYDGSTMRLSAAANGSVRALFWRTGADHGDVGVTFAVAELEGGRVAMIGDSSPADDGTGDGNLHDGWNDPAGDNRELFLNTTAWLVRDSEAR